MDVTPYSTITGFANSAPAYVPWIIDQQRLMSYQLYEAIYWNVPDTFKLVARGTEDKPIYLPSGKKIVDTIDRYVGANFNWVGSTPEVQTFFDNLFAREAFRSQFQGNKLYGIIRGDWCWHVLANPDKTEGKRLTIKALDPGQYFPIFDDDDVDRVVGCHIIEIVDNPDQAGQQVIKRLTYLKTESGIIREVGLFKLDEWGNVNSEPVKLLRPAELLPPEITALPVYHIKNFYEPQNPFGSSELRGMERLISALNQSISDQDLTLAMDGLGLYKTNMTTEDGEWGIGPAKVLEMNGGSKDDFFERVKGVTDVAPYLDHINFLMGELMSGKGISAVATGKVDVSVAESGVALLLELAPILAAAEKKDQLLLDTHNQMFYDLINGWVPAYEGVSFGEGAELTAHTGDKLPVNRKQRFQELMSLLTARVVDTEYVRVELRKIGYEFPEDMNSRVRAELNDLTDPLTNRLISGLDGG